MLGNELAVALLDTILDVNLQNQYSPVVLILKKPETAKLILDGFKNRCNEQGILLLNGSEMILRRQTKFAKEHNIRIIFEGLQWIAKKEEEEQIFFELYNFASDNEIPMVVTLNEEADFFRFEGRNMSRLRSGVIDSIV